MNQKIKIKHLLLSQSLWLRTLSTTQPHGNTSTVRQHFQRSCRNISEIDFIYRWERLSLPVADFHRSVTSSSVYTLACVWYEWIRELRGGKAHRMISLLYGEKKIMKCLGFFYFLWRPQVVLTELFRCHTGNRSNCISVTDHCSATSNRPEAKAAEMNGCCVQAPVHSHTDYINISPRQRSWTWFRWSVTHTAEQ